MTENRFVAATITLSDLSARGAREDVSGRILRELLVEAGATLIEHRILPDELELIRNNLLELCDRVDVILTTGGTGISPRDVTPEATAAVVAKRIPGIEAALHLSARDTVPTAILSRSVAGTRGSCLIINLPGSPGGVRDGMQVLAPILQHAVRLLKGQVGDCRTDLDVSADK